MAGRHLPPQRRPSGVLRVEEPLTAEQAAELSRRIEAWHVDVAPGPPAGPERAAAWIVLAGLAGCLAILLVPLWLVLR